MYVSNNLVHYEFFNKPMANKNVIAKISALSENVKIASLNQNLIRRMLNTSEHVNIKTRTNIVDEFTQQLLNSGYDWDQVRKIIVSGLTGYENMVSRAKRTGSGLHRSAAEGAQERRRKKLLAKSSWFRSAPKTDNSSGPRKGNQEPRKQREEPVSVIFMSQVMTRRLLILESRTSPNLQYTVENRR